MRKRFVRPFTLMMTILLALVFCMPSQTIAAVKNTYAVPETLDAAFTPDTIVLDGLPDNAYSNAPVGSIDNAKTAAGNENYTAGDSATGELRAIWNGPALYVLVTVNDTTVSKSSGTVNNRDGVEFSLDVWNDKIDKWEDDDGLFTVSSKGEITGAAGNQTGSVHYDKSSREFTNRIKGAAASDIIDPDTGMVIGYNVELALQIENVFDSSNSLQNGRKIGFDVQINDSAAENQARKARVFWSHDDNNYARISTQDGNLDWGVITLAGKTPEAFFVFDDWRIKELIRFTTDGKFRTGPGVYTSATEEIFNTRLSAAKALIDSGSKDKAAIDKAAEDLSKAILGLRREGKYPDPYELPSQFTLPDPFTFFDKTKGTGGKVTTVKEWEERRKEILDLAKYYEYGYTQEGTVILRSVISTDSTITINYTVSANGKSLNLSSTITLPTAFPNGPAPIVMGDSGDAYRNAGIATATVPQTAADDRINGINSRSGGYWELFPYNRNNPTEPGVEIAAAWGYWRTIDAYELAAAQNPDIGTKGKFNDLVDVKKLASYGFSINGKISFLAGVFDERIGVVIAGAAGCTGPSPYRYNNFAPGPWNTEEYVGQHIYSWGNTEGNEVLGDVLTHQPQRVNEMLLRFTSPLNLYKRVEGSYGYGDRLPFDQHLLVAAIAPRAIVVDHTKDDYGNSPEGDATGLEAAKPVYEWLGAGSDKLAFNWRNSGGHGVDATVTGRNAEYINYFFNKAALSPESQQALFTNPYIADVINGKNVYDRYFGGLNTMMPWKNSLPEMVPEIVIKIQPATKTDLLSGYKTGPNLKIEAENRGSTGKTLSYQWYYNTTNSTVGGTPVEGATLPEFNIPVGLESGIHYYYAEVNSNSGAPKLLSNIAQVSVKAASTDVSVKSVAINITTGDWWNRVTTAYKGTPDNNDSKVYNILLPYGTNLNALAVTDLDITPNVTATVGSLTKQENGAKWTFIVSAEDGTTTANYTVNVSAPFIPVTEITGVPARKSVGLNLKLSETPSFFGGSTFSLGKIQPNNATYKNIVWSIKDDGGTGAIITNAGDGVWTSAVKTLTTTTTGAIVLNATITSGSAIDLNYSQDFKIEVLDYDPDIDLVGAAISSIECGRYEIPLRDQADQTTKTGWVQSAVNLNIPAGNGSVAAVNFDGGYSVLVSKGAITSPAAITVTEQVPTELESVEAAITAISSGSYNIPVASQINQSAKTQWVQTAVNVLIPSGNGSTATVTYNGTYTVSVTKGSVSRNISINVTEQPPTSNPSPTTSSGNSVNVQSGKTVLVNGVEVNAVQNPDGGLTLTLDAASLLKYPADKDEIIIDFKKENNVMLNMQISALGKAAITANSQFGSLQLSNDVLQNLKMLYGDTITISMKKGSIIIGLTVNGKAVIYNDPAHPFIVTLSVDDISKSDSLVVVKKDDGKNTILPFAVVKEGKISFKAMGTGEYDVINNAKNYIDVSDSWAAEYIKFASARELFTGIDQNRFDPRGSMTRAMFVQVLSKLDKADLSEYKSTRFSDVSTEKWYSAAVEWAAERGITTGTASGSFNPDKKITREEMTVMLYNYMKYKEYSIPAATQKNFSDSQKISSWSAEAVNAISNAGIMGGKPGNLFDPQGFASRAEVATIFTRFIEIFSL